MGQTEAPVKPQRRFFNIKGLGKAIGIETVQTPSVATAPTVDVNAPHLGEIKTTPMDINTVAAPPVSTGENKAIQLPSAVPAEAAPTSVPVPSAFNEAFKREPADTLNPTAPAMSSEASTPTVSVPATNDHHEASFLNPNPVVAQVEAPAPPVAAETPPQPVAAAELPPAQETAEPAATVVEAQLTPPSVSENTVISPEVSEVVPVEHESVEPAPIAQPVAQIVEAQNAAVPAEPEKKPDEPLVNNPEPVPVPTAIQDSFADAPEDALDPTKSAEETTSPKNVVPEDPVATEILLKDPKKYIDEDGNINMNELRAAKFAYKVRQNPTAANLFKQLSEIGIEREDAVEQLLKPFLDKVS